MPQSYGYRGGSGNRIGLIVVTTTASIVNGTIDNIINGTVANVIRFTAGQSGRDITFDFGTPRLITEATWYQDLVATHGTWQWQGSPNGSTWTNIGATFTLGSPATQVITTLSGNATYYRYYRMLQTSGTTSSANYIREIEFSIDAKSTAWNPSDKEAGITLSGGNLIATNSNNAICGVRAVDGKTAGKFYYEVICTTATGSQNCVGIASGSYSRTLLGDTASGAIGNAVLGRLGAVIVDGATSGLTIGGSGSTSLLFPTTTSGMVICVAVDLGAKLIWFRQGAAGDWNNAAGRDPAAGTGGVSIPNLGGATAAYPCAAVNNTNDASTANFGDSTFTGAVPAGFTSGFPPPPTDARLTQAALEQWAMPNADAEATQVGLEMWAGVPAGTRLTLLTQIALEQWGTATTPTVKRAANTAVTIMV